MLRYCLFIEKMQSVQVNPRVQLTGVLLYDTSLSQHLVMC
jgi:hypothetical protein